MGTTSTARYNTENQALANHWYLAEHVLLHALVKYTIQFALQHTFVYTRYNHIFWAITVSVSAGNGWQCQYTVTG